MEKNFVENVVIENAHIIFRNFSGTATKFNRAGNRNFCVIIDDQDAYNEMKALGWGVKELNPRDPDEEPTKYMKVNVSYGYNPPVIYLISGGKKKALSEETVGTLDHVEIKNIDLVIRPYAWDVSGRQGISGYLKSMYVTLNEDAFADKYSDIPGVDTEEDALPF